VQEHVLERLSFARPRDLAERNSPSIIIRATQKNRMS